MTQLRRTPRPAGSPRCERGDVLALADASDDEAVRLFRVQDVVRLVRLLRFGDDDFVDEDDALDSVPAAYAGKAYVLLSPLAGPFGSLAEAEAAYAAGLETALDVAPALECRELDDLGAVTAAVWPSVAPPGDSGATR
jgi:hypothetical protein